MQLQQHIRDCYEHINPVGINAPVLISQKGTVYTVQRINVMLKEIKKKYRLHIGNFSCHSLRKTFGRQVYNMNSDNSELALVKLMELFNHSSVSITKRYLGLRQEELLNIRLESSRSGVIPLRTFTALSEQAEHCHVVPEATDDASLGRVYAANGSIPEVKDVPDKVFELLDFQLLGRRIRQSAGGVFTRQGYVVPDGNWKPTEGQEPRIAPEAPTGFFRLELRLGEERAELTLPAGQELVEVRERMEAVGLPNCAVTAFHSRVPQLPAAWVTPERLDTLNCLAIRLMVLAERDSLALIKYKAVLEVSSISSLEDAMALAERLDAYNLNWAAASPEDVARGELRRSMGEENADLLCRYLNLYGYGEALIQQYGGELTDYGLLTRADGQPVQKPLPPQPGLNSMGMRCP